MTHMVEPGETRKISRSIQWKLNLAEVIMQVDDLPEDALRMFVKMQYSKMHEGAAAESYQQINVEEAISQYGGDTREALKRYMKSWFQLNYPLENGTLGPAPTDAPPIVQRVWKNLEQLLLHPLETEVSIAKEIQKRTEAFETAAKEYSVRLAAALKTFEKLSSPKKEWADKLQEAYTNIERAARDIEELRKEHDAKKTALEDAEKRIETQEKRIQTDEKQIEGIRREAERTVKEYKDNLEKKANLAKDLTAAVESATEENEKLSKRVAELEAAVEKGRTDSTTYLQANEKLQLNYNNKERELLQEKEITKAERGKIETLEKKLAKARAGKWGAALGAAAAGFLAAALMFYHRPPQEIVPSGPVPEETTRYAGEGRIMVNFGKEQYNVGADTLSKIYTEIQRDQQKANKKFTPAERKKYFESKSDSVHYIK